METPTRALHRWAVSSSQTLHQEQNFSARLGLTEKYCLPRNGLARPIEVGKLTICLGLIKNIDQLRC